VMWDIAQKRIPNEKVKKTAGNSHTMESMMEMRRRRWLSKLSAIEKSRSPRRMLGAVCLLAQVSNNTTDRSRRISNSDSPTMLYDISVCMRKSLSGHDHHTLSVSPPLPYKPPYTSRLGATFSAIAVILPPTNEVTLARIENTLTPGGECISVVQAPGSLFYILQSVFLSMVRKFFA
jgi:hypothetical protein